MNTELFTVTLAVLCLATPVVGRAQHGAPTSAQDIKPLLIGASVPDVTLQTPDGKAFNLKAAAAKKPTVLIFYRGGWCPYCNTYLGQLQAAEADLLNLGYQILAISPDRPPKLGESVEKGKLTYTLLSDSSMTAAQAFGIAFRVDDATLEKYKGYNIDLEAASGEKHHLLPVPAVFIVGTDGVISFAYVNPDYKVRLESAKIIEAARGALSGVWALPEPRREGGMPLLSALAARRSTRAFSQEPIPTQLLSDLLWSAFGVNRPDSGKRTAPSSYNWQDITLYVFTSDGVYIYDAARHALTPVRRGDHRKLAGLQGYVWEAPLSLVYVSDQTRMRQGDEVFSHEYKTLIGGVDAGHISQNVYLFCASEGLGAVTRASVDAKAFADAFDLPADHKVIMGQTVGFATEE